MLSIGRTGNRGRGREGGAKGNLKSNSTFIPQHSEHTEAEAGSLSWSTQAVRISWMFSPAGEGLWQTQRGEKHSCLLLLTAYIWWWGTSSSWADLISHLDSLTAYLELKGMGLPPDMSPDTIQVQVHGMFKFISNQISFSCKYKCDSLEIQVCRALCDPQHFWELQCILGPNCWQIQVEK